MDYRCPVCGRPTEYRPELNGLCEDCYARISGRKIVVREEIKYVLTVCPYCWRMKFGKGWVRLNERNVERALLQQTKKRRMFRGYDAAFEFPNTLLRDIKEGGESRAVLVLRSSGVVSKRIDARIKVQWAICSFCSRKLEGRYYEMLIRVRVADKRRKNAVSLALMRLSKLAEKEGLENLNVRRVSQGLDIRVPDMALGERILKEVFGDATHVESYYERIYDKALNRQINVKKVLVQL